MTNPSMINSVIKAFRILEVIGESRSGYTLTQLVKKLSMSVGAVQRLTRTLVVLQYLYKEPETKTFHLAPKIFQFGFSFLNQSEIREIALPYLRQLNEDLDEVVNLGVAISDEEVVYIERIDKTSHILTTNLRVGSRRPIHLNSVGKVILAFLPEGDQRRILDHLYSDKSAGKDLTGKNKLLAKLQDIRRRGYSANKSDLFKDILALAVPILNHQGLPVAGINIVIPRRIPPDQIKRKYLPALIETGKEISMALGHMKEKAG
jgi:DNA-binding IclR family transcriptional regulator